MSEKRHKFGNFGRIFNGVFLVLILGVIGVALTVVYRSDWRQSPDPQIVDSPEDVSVLETANPGTLITVSPTSDEGWGVSIENGGDTDEDNENQKVVVVPVRFSGVLENPGIGWIYRSGEREYNQIPSSIAYPERSQISWKNLNPAENVYRWEILDQLLEAAISQGRQFAFRVYTMRGESNNQHQLPEWVLDRGAVLLSTGEPDYSNCTYQEEWGKFVNALAERYDGNPDIAFIDISGYGNFNEWSWQDSQTVWDDTWEQAYDLGVASPSSFSTLDGQARRRMADMFIGGRFVGHACRSADNLRETVNYSYAGFSKTQLVLPYAGIVQSTEYVFSRRQDVGFRHDCLGRWNSEGIPEKIYQELPIIWQYAPVVFETCSEDSFDLHSAMTLFHQSGGSIIYNINIPWLDVGDMAPLVLEAGYRYYLAQAEFSAVGVVGGAFDIAMTWQNVGGAPNYPKMGQDFELHLYLEDQISGQEVDVILNEDISAWLPGGDGYQLEYAISLPSEISAGEYLLGIGILDLRTGKLINLAVEGAEAGGLLVLGKVSVINP